MHSCSVFYVFWGIPHWCADSFTYLSCLRISCMELCFSIYLFTWVVKDQQEALLFRYHSYGKEWTQINAILWLWQTYLSLTCLFVPAIMYRNSIPRCLCFPAQVVVFVPFCWSIGFWVTSVNTNPQVKKKKKNLHILSCTLSDHRVMQLAPVAQLTLLYVCSNQKSRWALTDRRCPWIEPVQNVRCACFAVTAGWHRSCGWSLDNHMISFCRSSGGEQSVVKPFLY